MRAFSATALMLLATLTVAAQNQPPPVCPAISLSGPAGITAPDQDLSFRLILDSLADSYDLKFEWVLSTGIIVSGQGTRTLTARFGDSNRGQSLSATVFISGLPEGCVESITETSIYCTPPRLTLLDETDEMPDRLSSDRFISIDETARNIPSAQLFILIYTPQDAQPVRSFSTTRSALIERFRKLTEIDLDRITFVESTGGKHLIKIYLVPAGAEVPQP